MNLPHTSICMFFRARNPFLTIAEHKWAMNCLFYSKYAFFMLKICGFYPEFSKKGKYRELNYQTTVFIQLLLKCVNKCVKENEKYLLDLKSIAPRLPYTSNTLK